MIESRFASIPPILSIGFNNSAFNWSYPIELLSCSRIKVGSLIHIPEHLSGSSATVPIWETG